MESLTPPASMLILKSPTNILISWKQLEIAKIYQKIWKQYQLSINTKIFQLDETLRLYMKRQGKMVQEENATNNSSLKEITQAIQILAEKDSYFLKTKEKKSFPSNDKDLYPLVQGWLGVWEKVFQTGFLNKWEWKNRKETPFVDDGSPVPQVQEGEAQTIVEKARKIDIELRDLFSTLYNPSTFKKSSSQAKTNNLSSYKRIKRKSGNLTFHGAPSGLPNSLSQKMHITNSLNWQGTPKSLREGEETEALVEILRKLNPKSPPSTIRNKASKILEQSGLLVFETDAKSEIPDSKSETSETSDSETSIDCEGKEIVFRKDKKSSSQVVDPKAVQKKNGKLNTLKPPSNEEDFGVSIEDIYLGNLTKDFGVSIKDIYLGNLTKDFGVSIEDIYLGNLTNHFGVNI